MEVRSKYESPLVLEKIEIVESSFRKRTDYACFFCVLAA